MKLNRRQLRKMILKEINENMSGKIAIFNMVEEIEGSHGGLDTEEAAEELVRRLVSLPGQEDPSSILSSVAHSMNMDWIRADYHDSVEELAEEVLSGILRQRSDERRSRY